MGWKLNTRFLSLLLWVLCLSIVSALIGHLSRNAVDGWYLALNRSSLTPPNFVFGIVWSFLYALIAICGWRIWRDSGSQYGMLKIVFCAQLILNWTWTPLFFVYHLTGLALVCILLIIAAVAWLILATYKNLRMISVLLMPYIVWSIFAAYLNFYIYQHN